MQHMDASFPLMQYLPSLNFNFREDNSSVSLCRRSQMRISFCLNAMNVDASLKA
jgi:hypothetical protein